MFREAWENTLGRKMVTAQCSYWSVAVIWVIGKGIVVEVFKSPTVNRLRFYTERIFFSFLISHHASEESQFLTAQRYSTVSGHTVFAGHPVLTTVRQKPQSQCWIGMDAGMSHPGSGAPYHFPSIIGEDPDEK